jgi:hypothetical protein
MPNLNLVGIALLAVAVIVTALKARHAYFARRVMTTTYVLWGETLFYVMGVGSILGGIVEIMKIAVVGSLASPAVAPYMVGVACMQMALGVVGVISLWRGYEFRLAATILSTVFGVAWLVQGAYFAFALPLLLVVLTWLSREAHERTERTY